MKYLFLVISLLLLVSCNEPNYSIYNEKSSYYTVSHLEIFKHGGRDIRYYVYLQNEKETIKLENMDSDSYETLKKGDRVLLV